MKNEYFALAIDDSDSRGGGCTTHLLGLILQRIKDEVILLDYPSLVRLAPGIPWKTRGNASVSIRGVLKHKGIDWLLDIVTAMTEEYSEDRGLEPGKGPGIALYRGLDPWNNHLLRRFYLEAVKGPVHIRAALTVASKSNVRLAGGRGRIGALAALAALAPGDPFTFELIAYRRPENWGKPRCVINDISIEKDLPPCVFNNFDYARQRLIAAPHGPDPVLAGFRGTCPGALGCYAKLLCEEPHFWVLYRTNQHTGIHVNNRMRSRPYESGTFEAVITQVKRIPGSHVIAKINGTWIAAYRETGPVKQIIVEASGLKASIQGEGTIIPRTQGLTISVEAVTKIVSNPKTAVVAPRCPRCGSRMKSAGRGKGYKCLKCDYRDRQAQPIRLVIPPKISSSRVTPTESYLGHLTRPSYLYVLPDRYNAPSIDQVLSNGVTPPRGTTTLCEAGGKRDL